MPEFVKVAELSELRTGTGMSVEVNGKTIALFNVDGTIYAMDNTCLHRGGPLGEGFLDGHIVTCPLHLWEYDVTTGEVCGDPDQKLNTYAVHVDGNDIKVGI